MKKLSALALILAGLGSTAQAAGPTATYQWDFNLTNPAPATNLVQSKVPGGDLQGPAPTTPEAVLQMQNSSASPVNLLGLPLSGVGTNIFDRAALLAGTMGGSGPIIRTIALANTLTNLGILTNFTVTAWIKADGAFSGFPRILMFAHQNLTPAHALTHVPFF